MANLKNKECMAYKNKLNYIAEYNKKYAVKKLLSFNILNETDLMILEFMKTKSSVSAYVKKLILADMTQENIVTILQK